MLTWILQITIISFIFIFLVHHLFQFFRDTLTVPKFKDLVNTPSKKYENIYEILSKHDNNNNKLMKNDSYSSTDIHLLPIMQQNTKSSTNTNTNTNNSMKDELKIFLKSQLQPNDKEEQTYYQFK